MEKIFEIASGSVTGEDHRAVGTNNHDASLVYTSSEVLIALVCDGCSQGTHSEVGAKLGVRLFTQALRLAIDRLSSERVLLVSNLSHTDSLLWQRVYQDVLAHLRILGNAMGGSLSQIVNHYFSFTIVGAILLPEGLWVFSQGDGIFAVNGDITPIGPFPENVPPYLVFNGLAQPDNPYLTPDVLKVTIHRVLPLQEVQSVLVGTDGISDFIRVANRNLPGKPELVGPLDQFWKQDRYFLNPDLVRRRLMAANTTSIRMIAQPDGTRRLKKEEGLLPDDTTLVVIRRRQESP